MSMLMLPSLQGEEEVDLVWLCILVNPSNGKESIIQWASRRQTSMATSAPEAEVSAMAEGFAASIFLFDTPQVKSD